MWLFFSFSFLFFGGVYFVSDSQHWAHGCKHIRETNSKQTNRPFFTALALELSNNEVAFVLLHFFLVFL